MAVSPGYLPQPNPAFLSAPPQAPVPYPTPIATLCQRLITNCYCKHKTSFVISCSWNKLPSNPLWAPLLIGNRLWPSLLFAIKAGLRRWAYCPSSEANAESGKQWRPRRARPKRPSASLLFLPRATAIACKERLTAEPFGLALRQFLINRGALKLKAWHTLLCHAALFGQTSLCDTIDTPHLTSPK